ncbi:DUF1851 domain-containing protein [Marinobacter halodurans]|uniref:DUF1851 domain-containing protein n=1 Tax=Marinobacter halodurans TaxID=2528979 RepID=A0ABY1ZH72_9GAMM|nr:T6SS immunity protein Tdi1 domain-containing protein [Marinobacter halodurans]TBW45982.1 DUF1851 domain-containing protein [Marinobacter halodurans]
MFEKFQSKYEKDKVKEGAESLSFDLPIKATGLSEFLGNYSGSSFGGLYRVHSVQNIGKWNQVVGKAFPEFKNRIFCFGYDWLGRQFALDRKRIESGEPLILMLEPGTGEVLEIPVNFVQFHEDELVDYANEALAAEFFQEWLAAGNASPKLDQCVGYKKHLFLNGSDTIENLELTDLEVYWDISSQLLEKVRGLPLGTPIKNITIS